MEKLLFSTLGLIFGALLTIFGAVLIMKSKEKKSDNIIEKAKKEVEKLSEEAICILKDCSGDSAFLEELTKYLIHRKK